MYDVVIIGAGVSGCAVARELSKFQVKACVVEKEEDVCCGTSKANSAIVHAGYDAQNGSLMARLNVLGNEMMENLSKELDFPFKRNGSMVVCFRPEDEKKLYDLMENGKKNGVKGLKILSREEALQLEPNLSDEVTKVLYAPTGGIVCPFNLTIALAENANQNGVEFKFNTEVMNIIKQETGYLLKTNQGEIESKVIVNAAGVYADKFHNMVSEKKMHIIPRRGDYCLLDKSAGTHVSHTVFSLPEKNGKGVLVTPTVHGNLLVGPTAIDIEEKEGTATTREGLDKVIEASGRSVKNIPMRQVITSFAGLRAHEDRHEFFIEELKEAKGFVDVAGIESPGLSSAPAIGVMAAEIVKDILDLKQNEEFQAERKGILNPETLSKEERKELIRKNPAYGNIICRCEMITEGEIIDSIKRPIGAKSLDGVKRRTRAGMGRCQSGFCSPRTMEILARELEMDMMDVTKSGGQSKLIVGHIKEEIE
ncbi:NAD(P)/FAD-dependent oxidoreductase [Velocimicrobium porci]|uniref:NAD(P)/FAD-dependent oxidoreductase n=1 Tax=Velocimicrobium porci TaxID=2606634 RepID=A0A6L5XVG0_9FIRM|nr:NAD(P)/FAD-dependent oxidoreductase [Velocimicrobium porci]MSS62619.1 NAD(P)/FAD-dependent oxidoreductase [Velocimicrobium porci]